ncbi:MAG: alkaline phosphatase family protein [Anaerolineaceae bacterium]
MKKSILLVISSVLCVVLAVVAYFWVTGMISSNYAFRSPLKDTPPAAGDKLGEASTNRVVIVLIDALRYDTSLNKAVMPTLNKLRSEGAQALMHSQVPSFSEPGYTTILTGAWPWLNDGPAFNLDYGEIPTFTQDDLFTATHKAGLTTAISGYYWFEELVPQSSVDLSFYTPGEDRVADEDVVAAALPWLKENKSQLTLIHIDQVDYAGHHEGGPRSKNWTDAATRADTELAQIVATLDLQKDTLLVISDHGQIDAGGHGGQDPICLLEPFVMVGAGVVPGDYGDVNMVDIAPTLSALLGVNLPASTMGEVRTSMLNLPASVTAALPAAVEKQQTTLLTTFAKAIGAKLSENKIPTGSNVSAYQSVMNELRVNREIKERIPRAVVAALFMAFIAFLLMRNWKKGALAWIIGGVVFMALFNFKYAIWDQKTYSVSSIISQTDLIMSTAITAGLALLITWLAIMLDQKYFKSTPSEAAKRTFGLILTTAFIAGIPAILNFVLNGVLVTWTLPNYLFSFLFILSGIQILVISLLGLVLVGITALVALLVSKRAAKKALKKVKKTK